MSNLKKKLGIVLIIIIAFVCGKYTQPAKIQIKEVEKVVYVKTENVDRNVQVETTETIKPDNTKVIVTKTIDLSKVNSSTLVQSQKETITKKENKPNYLIGLGYFPYQQPSYSIELGARLGNMPFLVGGQYIRQGQENKALLKVFMEF